MRLKKVLRVWYSEIAVALSAIVTDGLVISFVLVDFGGEIKKGDIYYDLAKLNHNLLFNHEIINQGHYKLETINNKIRCDVFRSDILTNCREKLHSFIKNKGFDLKKVKLLTAIIWLNMSPLHGPKLGRFLYYLGKINLYKVIKNVS